jgi:hypothetical protein
MKPEIANSKAVRDIDAQVAKVLRGLGNPPPPLKLADVLELLKLNRGFYSSQDDGALREVVNRAVIAGKQIFKRPTLLLDAFRKWDIKAFYIPDKKRILLDSTEPEAKWRWNEAHEVVHSIIPWHAEFLHGDNRFSLSPDCHKELEAEANYGSGRLLFLQDVFTEFVNASKPSFALVKEAKSVFGNSLTSCLWRLVETLPFPALGIVCQHPRYPKSDFDAEMPCRYFICSPSFTQRFAKVSEVAAFQLLKDNCSWSKRGPLADNEVVLTDDSGKRHLFMLEAFNNQYETLSLFRHLHEIRGSIVVPFTFTMQPTRSPEGD